MEQTATVAFRTGKGGFKISATHRRHHEGQFTLCCIKIPEGATYGRGAMNCTKCFRARIDAPQAYRYSGRREVSHDEVRAAVAEYEAKGGLIEKLKPKYMIPGANRLNPVGLKMERGTQIVPIHAAEF